MGVQMGFLLTGPIPGRLLAEDIGLIAVLAGSKYGFGVVIVCVCFVFSSFSSVPFLVLGKQDLPSY